MPSPFRNVQQLPILFLLTYYPVYVLHKEKQIIKKQTLSIFKSEFFY